MASRSIIAKLLLQVFSPPPPTEIILKITDEACRSDEPVLTYTVERRIRNAASKPPKDGSCPFLELPTELRRVIFAASVPNADAAFPATCGDEKPTPKRCGNRIIGLMLLNRRIKDEIAEMLYEERTFAIHVHSGIKTGGIEFLNVGRQPLQYMSDNTDYRFHKFGAGDEFGFTRIKKIDLTIFPGGDGRHNALNTYYITLALARLLNGDGRDEKNRITSLKIVVLDGSPAQSQCEHRDSSFWWNATTNTPTNTSIQGLSHIHLALYPFSLLSAVHRAEVQLPPSLAQHVGTAVFVSQLEASMQALEGFGLFQCDNVDRQIESMRSAFEDYVFAALYGGRECTVTTTPAKITDAEHEAAKHESESLMQDVVVQTLNGAAKHERESFVEEEEVGFLYKQKVKKRTLVRGLRPDWEKQRYKVNDEEVGQFLDIAGNEATAEDAVEYLEKAAGVIERALAEWFAKDKVKEGWGDGSWSDDCGGEC